MSNTDNEVPTEVEIRAYLKELQRREAVDNRYQELLKALMVEVFEGKEEGCGKGGNPR